MLRVPADYSYFTAEKRIAPEYPSNALQSNISGNVILAVLYSTKGDVTWCGRILGDPVLVKTAMQAVAQWKFRPIKEKGKEIRGLTYVGFDFMISNLKVNVLFPFGNWPSEADITESNSPAREPDGANPKAQRLVRVSSGVAARNKLGGANPRYPESAKHDRVQGPVVLRGIIDETGHVALLEVISSPREDLSISAIEAVKQWEYKPYALNGQPVKVETAIQVNYTLR